MWLADDGVSSALIGMDYYKRSSAKFHRFLVSENLVMPLPVLKNIPTETDGLCHLVICFSWHITCSV
jgi:hypothetical protein